MFCITGCDKYDMLLYDCVVGFLAFICGNLNCTDNFTKSFMLAIEPLAVDITIQ